ncbi:hypothetical protein GCM10009119_28150 [Algoriphagus jejuensis]|uniref:Uncharacterized protein n=1 Tax=Algoriphagus jejuensis TaxID=419934 RepID=A0ABP3YGJ8_9BACT
MAIHLVACTSYSLILLNAEEQVENVGMQQLLEEEVLKKSDFIRSAFLLQNPFREKFFTSYFNENSGGFSSYVQEIHVPPPNFFPVIS